MIALAVVGTLLVVTLNSYTVTLKGTSEIEQLRNILNQVTAEASELITIAATTNSSTRVFVQVPTTIGYKQYWLQACNDSSNSWIEGSFGSKIATASLFHIYLPKGTSTSGYFIAGYGPAVLESYMNGSTVQFNLNYVGGR
jgi:type II secretory pathway pseudopilin PulG